MTTAAASGSPSRALVTGCIMMATFMQALDTTIANVALPFMQGSLSASQDQINWVLTSYIVASAIAMPATGYLATRFGLKQLFLFAVAGFTAASVLCGIATSLEEIVLYRLVQGVFGAAIVPLSQTVLFQIYPVERRGHAMAIWGVGIMFGPIIGPTLGGWLTETLNWRWVFFINIPFGVLTFLGLSAVLTDTKPNAGQRFDWFGFLLLGLAIGALQLALDRGEQLDWFGSTEIIAEFVLAGLCLYLFIVHTLTSNDPFLDPQLFKDRNFNLGLLFIFTTGTIMLASMALMTPFLQNLMGYPALTAGMVMAPRGAGTMFAMFLAGRLLGRLDARLIIAIGLTMAGWSLYDMSLYTPDVSENRMIVSGFVQGTGMGLLFVPLSTITFATLPPHFHTVGTALYSLLRSLGSSIGISIIISLLLRGTQVNHAVLAEQINPFNPLTRHLPGPWSLDHATGLALIDAEITRQATAIAFSNDFWLMMFVTLAALPLLLLMRPPKHQAAGPAVVAD